MKREAWNPSIARSMAASQWLMRRIKMEGFTPNADFAQRIGCHPILCWLDDEECLMIASPASPVEDASEQLDRVEKRIGELESEIKIVLAQHRLLDLVKKDDVNTQEES